MGRRGLDAYNGCSGGNGPDIHTGGLAVTLADWYAGGDVLDRTLAHWWGS
jgi:hypothetical protein